MRVRKDREQLLRERLGELRAPDEEGAERRGRAVVRAAFAERSPGRRRTSLPRLAIAMAAITLLAALLLSPAGAAVRDWIDDALTTGVQDAEPALTDVPGGGRLLVGSPSGPWVVQPDGSRRLLGAYREATWSPRGLFVAAAGEHTLSAVKPDGTVRWTLPAAPPVTTPRWSPSGVRIAYRSGDQLRVVIGDGEGDRLVDRGVGPVAPAWAPLGPHLLAYLRAGGGLRIADADSGRIHDSTGARSDLLSLSWSPDGARLMEAAERGAWLREVAVAKLAGGISIGPPRRLALPGRASVLAAAFSPVDGTIAVLLGLPPAGGLPARSEVLLFDPLGEGPPQRLYTAPGRLSDLDWSPGGTHLLIGWPGADQWLFVPAGGVGRVRAVGGIAAEFDPGGNTADLAFPRVEGWCCSPTGILP
jgi:hypothetical protein